MGFHFGGFTSFINPFARIKSVVSVVKRGGVKGLYNPAIQAKAITGVVKGEVTNATNVTRKTVGVVARSKIIRGVVGGVAQYFGMGSLNKPVNKWLDSVAGREANSKKQALLFPQIGHLQAAAGNPHPGNVAAHVLFPVESLWDLLFHRRR
jgi:hypothetical protein